MPLDGRRLPSPWAEALPSPSPWAEASAEEHASELPVEDDFDGWSVHLDQAWEPDKGEKREIELQRIIAEEYSAVNALPRDYDYERRSTSKARSKDAMVKMASISRGLASRTAMGMRSIAQVPSYRKRDLMPFLAWHFSMFSFKVFMMVELYRRRHFFFFFMFAICLGFEGSVLAYSSWNVKLSVWSKTWLPLKWFRPRALGLLLLIPYGWGQLAIPAFALEEWRELAMRASTGWVSVGANSFEGAVTDCSGHVRACLAGQMSSGIPVTFILLVIVLGKSFQLKDFRDVSLLMGLYMFVFSCGFGSLQADFWISVRVVARMKSRVKYQCLHWLFRTTEMIMRMSWYAAIKVIISAHNDLSEEHPLGSVPAIGTFLVTWVLIWVYGGCEQTWLVYPVCAVFCCCFNCFLFVDSPYKQAAARKLSRALQIRNAVEILLLMCLVGMMVLFKPRDSCDHMRCLLKEAFSVARIPILILTLLASTVLYWSLFFWITSLRGQGQDNWQKDIFSACEDGDADTVAELTSKSLLVFDVDCCDVYGRTPLMIAARSGRLLIVKVLLREGANVALHARRSLRFGDCWTAVHFAALGNHAQIAQMLLKWADNEAEAEAASRPAFLDYRGNTPLHVASRKGHLESIGVIVKCRPDFAEVRNRAGLTPAEVTESRAVQEALSSQCGMGTPLDSVKVDDGITSMDLLPRVTEVSDVSMRSRLSDSEDEEPCEFSIRKTQAGNMPNMPESPRTQAWPKLRVKVAKSLGEVKDGARLGAPGLASFFLSSAGGILATALLRDSEGPPSGGFGKTESMTRVRVDSDGVPLHPSTDRAQSITDVGQLASTSSSSMSKSRSSGSRRRREEQESLIANIEDLQPIDDQGEPVEWWVGLVEARKKAGRPVSGCVFANIPEEAGLGSGAFGNVWRARDKRTGLVVAVKNISVKQKGLETLASRECSIAHHIRLAPHPCVVNLILFHHFADAGMYSLVLEFCPGGDLKGKIKAARHKAKAEKGEYEIPAQSLQWVAHVFLGLEHLHLMTKCLLRDLKPDNVVLSERGHGRLTDFGVSRFGTESQGDWTFGMPPGTPGYTAPEVLAGESYNFKADLYSFGALIWVLLSGGVVDNPDPRPPTGKMTGKADYTSLADDWNRLKHAVKQPGPATCARPIPSSAGSLVLQLAERRPAARPAHKDIRKHPWIKAMKLPRYRSPPSTVSEWLERPDTWRESS